MKGSDKAWIFGANSGIVETTVENASKSINTPFWTLQSEALDAYAVRLYSEADRYDESAKQCRISGDRYREEARVAREREGTADARKETA